MTGPLFKRTCPCTRLAPPFSNFSDCPLSGEGNQNLLPPPSKTKRGGGWGVVRTINTQPVSQTGLNTI